MHHRGLVAGAHAGWRTAITSSLFGKLLHGCPPGVLAACALPAILLASGCSKNSTTGPATGAGAIITVTGRVLGQNGQTVAGIPVSIRGIPSTNTDASGSFSIAGVATPYDITVVNPTQNSALIYKGLTRSDPVLIYAGTSPGTKYTGSVTGKVTGGTFPSPGPRDVTRVVWCSPEITQGTNAATDGTFGFSPDWYGPSTTTGGIYALQFTADAAGFPVAGGYRGYGVKTALALASGSALSNQSDSLLPVTTTRLTAAVTVPAGYTLVRKELYLQFSSTGSLQIVSDTTRNTAPSYYTPQVTGGTISLGVVIAGTSGSESLTWKNGSAAGAAGVPLAPVVPPEQSLPLSGVTGVDTNVTFSWTAMPGAVHVIQFVAVNQANPSFAIITAGTSATIPNLKSLGLALPASASYQWDVFGFGPLSGTDAAAGSIAWVTGSSIPGPASVSYYGGTPFRTFTTAP